MRSKRICSLLTAAGCAWAAVCSFLSAAAGAGADYRGAADAAWGETASVSLSTATAEPGETVYIDVLIQDNPGFANCGLKIEYGDQGLLPVLKEDAVPDYQTGTPASRLMVTVLDNPETCTVGAGMIGMMNSTDNGILLTLIFTVPEDAVRGTRYPLTLTVDRFKDAGLYAVPCLAESGWIEVAP